MVTVIPIEEFDDRLYVNADIIVGGTNLLTVNFLVDTGANCTLFHPHDEDLMIQKAKLAHRSAQLPIHECSTEVVSGIGGKVKLRMLDTDNTFAI